MKLNGNDIVLATHNAGKIPEMAILVEPFGCAVSCAGDYDVPEPVEDGETFEANALLKARHCASITGKISMADDSGLCVVALDNAPGIYSARWAGETKDFAIARKKVQSELEKINATDMSAFFVCVLAVVDPTTGDEMVFRGESYGDISFPDRGEFGFGYDPIFVPTGFDITYGQMQPNEKTAMSHRTKAFEKMKEACFE